MENHGVIASHAGTLLVADESLYYTIQEVSERLGIPIQKLRRWDQDGVLQAQRSFGGHRRYLRELIDRLAAQSLTPDKSTRQLATIKKSLAEKQRIIQLLLDSEHRYRDLVETSHDLVWTTDPQGRFTYLNNAAREIFGLSPHELSGRCFFDFEAGNAHIANRRFLAQLRRNGEIKDYVTHVVTARGDSRWIGINARTLFDENREIMGIRGTARDITEQHLATRRIEHLAMHDTLTDLPNRVALQQRVDESIPSGTPGALLLLDIDHFKYVNDNYGHRVGDQLIRGVGSALREMMRGFSGELFRLGGDEFAIHLPGSLRQDAIQIADRALDTVQHYRLQASGHKGISNLSTSIGIALYPFHGANVSELLSNVDIAMYQAKEHGRNRYVIFDPGSDAMRSTHRRVQWSTKLREALDDDRLLLFAQPVVRLADRRVMHHEILLRLRDSEGRIVMPGNFIEIAESIGMVKDLDMRVVEKLLVHMHQHNQMGKKLRYFVNLSRASISDAHWVKRFISMLAVSKADPNQLVFEISETAAMSEIDVTLNFIRRLKDLGSRIALDNFGAGFSSFYYLKRFEVDYLKIDGGFIRDLAADSSNQVFVKALNDVAGGMGKQVIAEWVETPEVLELLQTIGARYGQGYLFGQPMPLENNRNGDLATGCNAA
jgi:diguanylate cyclase (GGDEF)-like protein/PAS domain S-box-containing protein/excisionase family DNA binding protein